MDFFKNLISKSYPESMMRFVVLFVYLFVVVTVFITWAAVSSYKQALQDFPTGLVAVVTLILGIPTYFKNQEKKEETKQNADYCIKSTLDTNQKS